jgi:mono/diheme cytochrome c family protein
VIPSLDGPTLFMTYCAVCHGQGADGRGAHGAYLENAGSGLDKDREAERRCLPAGTRGNIIAGTESSGHGTRQMPVWGPLFSEITSDRDYGKVRLYNVAKYLESIQKQ